MKRPTFKQILENMEKTYKENPDILECCHQKDNVMETVEKLVDLKDKIVLDLGCGTGRYAIPMAKKAERVYAVDYSRTMLKVLRRKIRENGIKNIRIINSDYGEIKFPDEYADVIFFSLSFPAHSKNRNADLRKFRKILKTGGVIIIVDTAVGGEWWNIRKIIGHGKSMIPRNTKWVLGKGFRRVKTMDAVLDYKNRKNILKSVKPFFGGEAAGYLIGKGKTSFKMRIAVFLWKKK